MRMEHCVHDHQRTIPSYREKTPATMDIRNIQYAVDLTLVAETR